MIVIVAFAFSFGASPQFVVRIRPVYPVIVRPIAPSHRHIWVDGEWIWRRGRYEYVNGYWAVPPEPRHRWHRGTGNIGWVVGLGTWSLEKRLVIIKNIWSKACTINVQAF